MKRRRVRDDGIAFCRGEQFEGIVGVAAPIPSTDGYRSPPSASPDRSPAERARSIEEDVTGQVLSTTKSIQVALPGN